MIYNPAEVLPGIEHERAPISPTGVVDSTLLGNTPQNFPRHIWNEQIDRYGEYWRWWQGEAFEETTGTTEDGEVLFRYPLKINSLRTYTRIHNSMLWGEIPDEKTPILNMRMTALPDFGEEKANDERRKNAKAYEQIINQVWEQSKARTILYEGGLISQFLGGYFYQLVYEPWRTDLRVPIRVRPLMPDYVLPIPDPTDPFELLEAFIVYRITPKAAEEQYGLKMKNPNDGRFVTYIEHWSRHECNIWIDGNPIEAQYFVPGQKTREKYSYNKRPNPFGFVPIVYIPRFREGSWYGSSIVPDIYSLMLEYNSRIADVADILAENNQPEYFGRNITSQIAPKTLDGDKQYYDLGVEIPGRSHPPEIWRMETPDLTPAMVNLTDVIAQEMQKMAGISEIAFGIDEGSQRSGVTLQIRLYPTIAAARAQRQNWSVALSSLNIKLLKMLAITNKVKVGGKAINLDDLVNYRADCAWHPYIPRDEEQETNRLVLLKQSGGMSTERMVELQNDVEDVEEEVERINNNMKQAAELSTMGNGQDEGARTETNDPVANTEVDDT